jgi:hypothetical protein
MTNDKSLWKYKNSVVTFAVRCVVVDDVMMGGWWDGFAWCAVAVWCLSVIVRNFFITFSFCVAEKSLKGFKRAKNDVLISWGTFVPCLPVPFLVITLHVLCRGLAKIPEDSHYLIGSMCTMLRPSSIITHQSTIDDHFAKRHFHPLRCCRFSDQQNKTTTYQLSIIITTIKSLPLASSNLLS